jgi:1,4-alpha-glucan branching enzyme
MVSKPTYLGGLGFGMKWDMGWMHDTLDYMGRDAIHRKFHHNQITFRMIYAFHENFILPLSHDEVVHGKGSLLAKMPGSDWQKFANLRLLFGCLYAQPGKKLIFMGGEIGQWSEWDHDTCIQWDLLTYLPHQGVQSWVRDLNRFYREDRALHGLDFEPAGFEWIDCNDSQQSVLSLLRRGRQREVVTVVVLNFTPVPRFSYHIGVEQSGVWVECLNSDGTEYGGSGMGNLGRLKAEPVTSHGRPYRLSLTLPPLSALFLKSESFRKDGVGG